MRESFVIYTKIKETVEKLSNEQKGQLFQAILDFETDKEPVFSDSAVELVFIPIRQDLERNNEKWEETRKKRSEAGRKGGAPKGNKNALKQANQSKQASDCIAETIDITGVKVGLKNNKKQAKQAKQAVYVNDNVNVYVNDSEKNITPLSPYDFDKHSNISNYNNLKENCEEECVRYISIHPELDECVSLWMKYKDERKPRSNNHYGETGLIQLLNRIHKQSLEYGAAQVVGVIKGSMSSNYQGIVWDWITKNKPQNNTIDSQQAYYNKWRDA